MPDRFELVFTQDAQLLIAQILGALGFIDPTGVAQVMGVLAEGDEIRADGFGGEAVWVGLKCAAMLDGFAGGELGDELGAAVLEIPEVMDVAVGEDDEAHVFGVGVGAGLFLADEGVLTLALGFENNEGKAVLIEEDVIGVAVGCRFEVAAELIEVVAGDGGDAFKLDSGGAVLVREETPAG